MRIPKTILPGHSSQLGASFDGSGVNFALYSAHADAVDLCLYEKQHEQEIARLTLPELTDNVWHGYVPEIGPDVYYGYRVHGKYAPQQGHWFNPNKLLIDPYARQLNKSVQLTELHFAYANSEDPLDGNADVRDNAAVMPKCVIPSPINKKSASKRFSPAHHRDIIYEAHIKSLTKLHPKLGSLERGKFKGVAHPSIISHLQSMSIDCLQLLPLLSFVTEPFLVSKKLTNYWGYNPVNFFALHNDYAIDSSATADEFADMVKVLHQHDIRLIMDTVYNHTAEGDHTGPILSFKGIDNVSYYRLSADGSQYINHSGTGNTLNLSHPRVLELVLSSMRYFVETLHVDGFRFDLATILGRNSNDEFDPNSTFFQTINQDPVLSKSKLIAEPWDIGPQGYQLGHFPHPWLQWNDKFRDTIRRFWRGDDGQLATLADCLLGSSKVFEHTTRGRKSVSSVNFVCCHDGFNLRDLVSYKHKHNEANGEHNADGHNHNHSNNYGAEGECEDDEIASLREKQSRNLMTTLLLSQGTPMILAGDELQHTQQGNNNAYCQDNEINWIHWAFNYMQTPFCNFMQYLSQLRRRQPLLRQRDFIHDRGRKGAYGLAEVGWYKIGAFPMQDHDWTEGNQSFLALSLSTGLATAKSSPSTSASVMLMILNANQFAADFDLNKIIPSDIPGDNTNWYCLLDTQRARFDKPYKINETMLRISARSIVIAAILD